MSRLLCGLAYASCFLVVSLSSTSPAGATAEPRFLFAWGTSGTRPGEFHSPIGIAIDPKDDVFVTDLNNARVQKFSAQGKHLGGFDLPWDAPGRRSTIIGGIAVDDAGRIYLSFMNQHKLAIYDQRGKVIREWGKKGSADGEFNQPGGIVLTPGDTLSVADQCNHRIQKFTRDGRFLARWGAHGKKPGQFDGFEPPGSRFGGPHFLAQDSAGRLYTTEGVHGRVQQFTPDGQPLAAWGNKTDEPGGFGAYKFSTLKNTFGPIGVAIDKRDRVWVSSLNNRVQCFTPQGHYLMGINVAGKEPGQLIHPHGMAFDSQNRLYVADSANQRIQVFEIQGP
jgi:sugar lactone lactonase YvrE